MAQEALKRRRGVRVRATPALIGKGAGSTVATVAVRTSRDFARDPLITQEQFRHGLPGGAVAFDDLPHLGLSEADPFSGVSVHSFRQANGRRAESLMSYL